MSSYVPKIYNHASKLASGTSNVDDYYAQNDDFYIIGDRVYVDVYKPASVVHFGEVHFGPGDWVGVVLDQPLGKHDGRVQGREYFQCRPMHGLFVRPWRLTRMHSDTNNSNLYSHYRQSTPSDGRWSQSVTLAGSNDRSTASKSPFATQNSPLFYDYLYDEDYRTPDCSQTLLRSTRQRRPETPSTASLRQYDIARNKDRDTNHRTLVKESPGQQNVQISRRLSISSSRPHSNLSSISARADDLSERLARAKIDSLQPSRPPSSVSSTSPRSPVFNFRPKRAPLTSSSSSSSIKSGLNEEKKERINPLRSSKINNNNNWKISPENYGFRKQPTISTILSTKSPTSSRSLSNLTGDLETKNSKKELFDDSELERELKISLRNNFFDHESSKVSKTVEHRFSRSRHGGTPIVHRLIFEA